LRKGFLEQEAIPMAHGRCGWRAQDDLGRPNHRKLKMGPPARGKRKRNRAPDFWGHW